jgi:hypothetical protein
MAGAFLGIEPRAPAIHPDLSTTSGSGCSALGMMAPGGPRIWHLPGMTPILIYISFVFLFYVLMEIRKYLHFSY